MKEEEFFPKNYFNLEKFGYRNLIVEDAPVWQTVAELATRIAKLFESGEVKRQTSKINGVTIVGKNVHIDETAEILPGTYIGDNVIIGKNCKIGPNAYIRKDAVIGDGYIIGNSTEVKNALLFGNLMAEHRPGAAHFNYIADSIIGFDVNLGAGTVLANMRYDFFETGNHILIRTDDDDKFDTGLQKFSSILGDKAQTGCHAVLLPGTIVGKGAILGGSANHRGVIPAGAKEY